MSTIEEKSKAKADLERPVMSQDKLIEIAKRSGWVRWHPSGIVEQLGQGCTEGEVWAEGPTTPTLSLFRPEYWCEEVPTPIKTILGTARECTGCKRRYYDQGRIPQCPVCGLMARPDCAKPAGQPSPQFSVTPTKVVPSPKIIYRQAVDLPDWRIQDKVYRGVRDENQLRAVFEERRRAERKVMDEALVLGKAHIHSMIRYTMQRWPGDKTLFHQYDKAAKQILFWWEPNG